MTRAAKECTNIMIEAENICNMLPKNTDGFLP